MLFIIGRENNTGHSTDKIRITRIEWRLKGQNESHLFHNRVCPTLLTPHPLLPASEMASIQLLLRDFPFQDYWPSGLILVVFSISQLKVCHIPTVECTRNIKCLVMEVLTGGFHYEIGHFETEKDVSFDVFHRWEDQWWTSLRPLGLDFSNQNLIVTTQTFQNNHQYPSPWHALWGDYIPSAGFSSP